MLSPSSSFVTISSQGKQENEKSKGTFAHQQVYDTRYTTINYLFCNAGILSTLGLNWKELVWIFFQDPAGFFERSDATIQATGEINEDGMGKVFAANVFGHYVMVSL